MDELLIVVLSHSTVVSLDFFLCIYIEYFFMKYPPPPRIDAMSISFFSLPSWKDKKLKLMD